MKSRHVDICVTCVSDKPPQLPLREELPSLGIELVYNSFSSDEKKSKSELKKGKYTDRAREKQKERRHDDQQLRPLHAMSYEEYEKQRMEKEQRDQTASSSSVSSLDTGT